MDMKRLLAILLMVAVLSLGLCACGDSQPANTSLPEGSAYSAVTTKALDALFNENLYCLQRILVLGTLPYATEPIDGGHLFPVQHDRFQTYAQLKEYLGTVYTADTVAALLDNKGMPVYTEVDGQLCVNTYHTGGKAYYVNWSKRKIVIDKIDDTGCHFTVTGAVVMPGGSTDSETYTATGTAVYENDRLLLTGLIQ